MRRAGFAVFSRNAVIGRKYRLTDKGIDTTREVVMVDISAHAPRPKKTKPVKPAVDPAQQEADAQARLAALLEKAAAMASSQDGVGYMENKRGCKALLERRSGKWNLPMCCGRPRGFDPEGRLTPYCDEHYALYHQGGRQYG